VVLARYQYLYQGLSYKENCVLAKSCLEAEVKEGSGGELVRRRHASHITIVLNKATHSGPSVCLRTEPPAHLAYLVPELITLRGASLLYSERAARARGCSASCRFLLFRGPWVKTVCTVLKKELSHVREPPCTL
jgi:hypothetical protein